MRLPAILFAAALAFSSGGAALAQATTGKVAVVAAQNFYGDIARQIGGDRVSVSSIMSSPDQDPHLFEATPSQVREIADAQIVIHNGGHYDEWMEKLLKAAPRPKRIVVSAAKIVNAKHGGNPHLWYAPTTMPAVAKAIAAAFSQADSGHAAEYTERLGKTLADLDRVSHRVAEMRAKHAGKPVAATEPVFGLMADAIGLTMRNQKFQRALMNETEPSARDIAAFEDDLKKGRVKVLIYNKQVSEKLAERLLTIARTAKVPVVAVTETQPAGVTFHDWMLGELDALDKALTGPSS
ncbi:MAG: zinc ABC transporter substrate-binding protein [Pseudolabrys sp.]|nr:zinc ABC transporter substrate-binding protein [Pseudolabrys sp.]MDP2294553.1 zinc ABC transporter substrate-binding protein [Pseudolabrys sp.]